MPQDQQLPHLKGGETVALVGPEPLLALSQIEIMERDIGKKCTLAFVSGDEKQPVIMGIIYEPGSQSGSTVVESDEGIILKSGKSRIELHANGRIHLQGMHISSQAYGPNQLKGASVKIN